MATVDLLIPAYNAASTVRETVDSVQRQTMTDWRMVIINDGSTDATGQMLAEMAAKDPRIHVHTQANRGVVDSLNVGLGLCTADIIARLDADDLCYPNRLQFQLDYLNAHPDVIGVGAGVRHIDDKSEPTGSTAQIQSPDLANPWFVPSAEPYLIHPFFTARRWAMEAVKGYRHVHYAEDTDLYWRLRSHGRLVNPPDILGDYRFHADSISSQGILNGRIMAINSQLTSISEQRRLRGVNDLIFTKDSLAEYKRVKTLREMMAIASVPLDATERAYLQAAVPAKLLELAAYRPYELERSDCECIGDLARAGFPMLSDANRRQMQRWITGAAARVAVAGRMKDARRMVPTRMYPSFAPRYLMRTVLPESLRRSVRRGDTKASTVK